MIGHFPTAYPDELLYSICARFGERVDYRHRLAVHVELFGNKGNVAIVDLPSHLGHLVANLPPGHPHTIDSLIDDYTLFRYYSPFIQAERRARARQLMAESSSQVVQMYLGRRTTRIQPPRSLQYCPQCVIDEREAYGECYWHRLHQAPGVKVCPRHACFLESGGAPAHDSVNAPRYLPAEKAVRSLVPRLADLTDPDHHILLKIAEDVAWLLKSDVIVPGLEALFACYKSILADNGLVTVGEYIRGTELFKLVETVYSPALLDLLDSSLEKRTYGAWPALLVQYLNQNTPTHPLRCLLMIRLFGYSAEAFFDRLQEINSSPPRSIPQPFGSGPWPCLNPAADHFRQPVIEICLVVKHQERNIPVGIFKCDCGFVYARNGPDAAPEDRFRIGRVKTYGPVWEESLKRMWNDASLTIRQISDRLKITGNGVKYRAYGLNLTFPRVGPGRSARAHAGIQNAIKETQAERESRLAIHRARWLEVRKEHPDATRKELRSTIAWGIYHWLNKHDREWLQSHLPPSRKEAQANDRIRWESLDIRMTEAIPAAAIRIRAADGPPVRVTMRAIILEIDADPGLLKKWTLVNRLPRTAQALKEAIETPVQFAIRRVKWAAENFRKEGILPSQRALWKQVYVHKKSKISREVVAAFEEAWQSLQ